MKIALRLRRMSRDNTGWKSLVSVGFVALLLLLVELIVRRLKTVEQMFEILIVKFLANFLD